MAKAKAAPKKEVPAEDDGTITREEAKAATVPTTPKALCILHF